ncbi:leucyl aminopeptidase family protein [Thiotrichales bacterium 19S11-10]|nr:leucyl aminopeptidase family protein [Thiotrichales bacterium 19S11-10]
MFKKLLEIPKIKTFQSNFKLTHTTIPDLIILVVKRLNQSVLQKSEFNSLILKRFKKQVKADDTSWITQLPNEMGTQFIIIKEDMAFEFMNELKNKLAQIKPITGNVSIINQTNSNDAEKNALKTVLAHSAQMPNFKKEKPNKTVDTITIYSLHDKDYVDYVTSGHKGNLFARYLAAMPTNYLKPSDYRLEISALAKHYQWQSHFYNYNELKKMGANLFCAVSRANPKEAFIVHLKYRHPKAQKQIAFVGKGICFDTGGVSLKQPQYMYQMHEDMQGSSVALGSLIAFTEAKAKANIDCFLAVTQNLIGEDAYLLNEVITALNGLTVEVVDTDAEGRMVLADTLYLASQEKPDLLIDYATLTGSAVRAISTHYMALFSHQLKKLSQYIQTGIDAGERAWPFPLSNDFDQMIKSDIADILQCSAAPSADHILAAKFLNHFIDHKKVKEWIHLDLAMSVNKGGLGPIPSDYTGAGVYYTLELLKDNI